MTSRFRLRLMAAVLAAAPAAILAQHPDWIQVTGARHVTGFASEGNVLWVGTASGLAKVDRATLQTLAFFNTANSAIPSNRVTGVAVDGLGNKWVGFFDRGAARFDGVSAFTPLRRPSPLPSDTVDAIAAQGSDVWIGTRRGLVHWNGSNYTLISGANFLPSDTVTSLAIGPTGRVWIGTVDGVAFWTAAGGTQNYTLNLPDRNITAVAVNANDSVWVGMAAGGAARLNGTIWQVTDLQNGLPSNLVTRLAIEADNTPWVGFSDAGVAKRTASGWSVYDTSAASGRALPDNNVRSLLAGTAGTVFVGTLSGGAVQHSAGAWADVETSDTPLPEDAVKAVAVAPDGKVWMCGSGYVSLWDGTDYTAWSPRDLGLTFGGFTGLVLDNQGRPWVSTFEDGIVHYNGTDWDLPVNTNTTGFPDNFVNAVAVNPLNNDVWVATYSGLGRYNGTAWTTYNTGTTPSIPSIVVRAVAAGPTGAVWIADDQSAGPYSFNGTAFSAPVSMAPIGVSPGAIQAIWVAETGNPWVGTGSQGLAHYNGTSWAYQWNTANSNIADNAVWSIQPDADANLWIGTSGGLSRLVRPGSFTDTYRSTGSGLPANLVRGIGVGPDNTVYAATDSGLAVYTGFSRVLEPALTLTRRDFMFDTLSTGQSDTLSAFIKNTGTAALRVDSLRLIQDLLTGFSVTRPAVPFSLAAGDSARLTLRFAPTSIQYNAALLKIVSSSPSSPDSAFLGGMTTSNSWFSDFRLRTRAYGLVSVPFDIAGDNGVVDVLSAGLGDYARSAWRIFHYYGGAYHEAAEGDTMFRFRPGRSFWLITRDSVEWLTIQNPRSTPGSGGYPIRLSPGWNMIANPFPQIVRWNTIANSNLVQKPVYWNPDSSAYEYTTAFNPMLIPWEGNFVYNPTSSPVTLSVAPPWTSLVKASNPARPLAAGEFFLDVRARGDKAGRPAAQAVAGMLASAENGVDLEDCFEAPPMAKGIRLSLLEAGNRCAVNVKALSGRGASWDVELSSTDEDGRVSLSLTGLGKLPRGFSAWLLDQDLGCLVPLLQGRAELKPGDGEGPRLLKLVVGTPEFAEAAAGGIPLESYSFALLPNYPNPFNPETRIEYSLARRGETAVEVYNTLGRRLNTLSRGVESAGVHRVVWDGRDEAGFPVPSGVYVCRVTQGRYAAFRKMVLVR